MRFFAGDVSPDGTKMYLNWNGGGIIYTVDLTTQPALPVAADPSITITPVNPENPIKICTTDSCTTDSTAGDCGRVADWAAHPTNGMLYGGNDTNKKVAILDPTTGARRDWGVTCGGGSNCLGTSTLGFGAAWFNAAGNLFLYNNDGTIYELANVGDCIPTDTACDELDPPMQVVSVQTGGPTSTFNDGAACIDVDNLAAITLTKTADPTTYSAVDDVITYSFTVFNSGNVTLTNVTVTDPLISPITCPSGNPIPSLASGDSEVCTGTYAISQDDIDNGSVLNTATATGTDPIGNQATDTDDETVTAQQNAAMTVYSDLRLPGDEHG
jgi:uncharacterized repeat protein (TIGR01451 family)